MMKRFGMPSAIFMMAVVGFLCQAVAAETTGCSNKISGQLLIVGADSECLPFEYCFGMADYQDALRFRIGTHHIGGNYYTLSGIEFDHDGKPNALSGSAVKIDDSLLMTFTIGLTSPGDGKNAYVMSKTGTITFNLKSLDVSFAMIDVRAYEDGDEHIGDSYDSLIYIACPQ